MMAITMNRNTKTIIAGMLVLLCCEASAQTRNRRTARQKALPKPAAQANTPNRADTTIKGATLNVYQKYEPVLKPVLKQEFTPSLPPRPKVADAQEYTVPQQTLVYSYRSLPLRPLALGKDSSVIPFANYALLGAGNWSTFLAEVGIGGFQGKQWQSAFQAKYLTQKGNLTGQVYRDFDVTGQGTLTTNGHLIDAGVQVANSVFGAYGYDHDRFSYSFDQLKRSRTNVTLSGGIRNETPGPWGISYHPKVSLNYFTATAVERETNFHLSIPVEKQFDEHLSAGIGVATWITNTVNDSLAKSNNILQFSPNLTYREGAFVGHLGLKPTFGATATYFLPDIKLQYKFSEAKLIISGAWLGNLEQNSARQLYATNPFLIGRSVFNIPQTKSDHVFAQLELGVGSHLNVWAQGGWKQFKNLPLFVNSATGDGKDLIAVNDPEVQAIEWGAGINYTIGEVFSVGASGNWNNFYKKSYDHVYGMPSIQFRGDIGWKPIPALKVSAYAEVMDQIWGIDLLGISRKTNSIIDLGLGAEYSFLKQLKGFLRVDNLLNRKNERWLGYPSFGINLYGGVVFLF